MTVPKLRILSFVFTVLCLKKYIYIIIIIIMVNFIGKVTQGIYQHHIAGTAQAMWTRI